MKWIKCSERMPEYGESVLVYGAECGICEACLSEGDWDKKVIKTPEGPTKTKTVKFQHPSSWQMPSSCCRPDYTRLDDITHWMELPEGPE